MMEMKRLAIPLVSLMLVACTGDEENIQAWMTEQERGMTGKVEPLPEIKPFPPVSYDAEGLIEPFDSARIEPESRSAVSGGPDLNRQKEPLEAYPLESLSMVGILTQEDRTHALVWADQALHQVRVGNYLGQNHGLVSAVTQSEVVLDELVEDVNGDWVERTSRLQLQER